MPQPEPQQATAGARRVTAAFGAFGAFWLDFLVGDTPELLLGVLIVIGAGALVVHQRAPRAVAVAAIPVLAIALLIASVLRRARSRH